MSARDAVLTRIRQSIGRPDGMDEARKAELTARMKNRPRGLIPERGIGEGAVLAANFTAQAEQVQASVREIASFDDVPAAVAEFLSAQNQPARAKIAPHPDLTGIDWSVRPMLEISQGPSDGGDPASVTRAFAGIAETGTLMLLAGPEGPTTLNFLPENHIVVVKKSELVGSYEDAWDRLRDRVGPDGMLSRVVNLITGPSRTADIEQTLELGAHGPIDLHILLVDD